MCFDIEMVKLSNYKVGLTYFVIALKKDLVKLPNLDSVGILWGQTLFAAMKTLAEGWRFLRDLVV